MASITHTGVTKARSSGGRSTAPVSGLAGTVGAAASGHQAGMDIKRALRPEHNACESESADNQSADKNDESADELFGSADELFGSADKNDQSADKNDESADELFGSADELFGSAS